MIDSYQYMTSRGVQGYALYGGLCTIFRDDFLPGHAEKIGGWVPFISHRAICFICERTVSIPKPLRVEDIFCADHKNRSKE